MATLQLRPYQLEAVDAAFSWCGTYEGHCLLTLPTGSGKSLVMGTLAARAIENHPPTRVLVMAHRKELIAQNVRAVSTVMPLGSIGVYSAGLKRRDTDHQIMVAGIQSIARRPYELGAFDLILIDEAHLCPPGDDGLYRKYLAAAKLQNPDVRFIGLTATPYRMGSGLLHRGKGALFTDVAYEANVRNLVDQGYLCRLVSKATIARLDTSGVAIRGGEYVAGQLEAAVDREEITSRIITETQKLAHDRRKILVFCSGVAHSEHVAEAFEAAGWPAAAVHGGLDAETRASRLYRFREGAIRVLTSMDVLTTGYDEPGIDCIVLLRPTRSTGLYVQMAGRGFRLHQDKPNTLVLDYAGVVALHGPVDAIEVQDREGARAVDGEAPSKVCPECAEIVHAGVRICPSCSHEFPPPERKPILPEASMAPVMSDEEVEITYHDVTHVEYGYHVARGEGKRPTLRVEYYHHYSRVASEWICLEHSGFAREKAERWWLVRSPESPPATIEDALELADDLRVPTRVATKPDGRFTRIVDYQFPPVSETMLPRACWTCGHWSDGNRMCNRWGTLPPEEVQQVGCETWEDVDAMFATAIMGRDEAPDNDSVRSAFGAPAER